MTEHNWEGFVSAVFSVKERRNAAKGRDIKEGCRSFEKKQGAVTEGEGDVGSRGFQ